MIISVVVAAAFAGEVRVVIFVLVAILSLGAVEAVIIMAIFFLEAIIENICNSLNRAVMKHNIITFAKLLIGDTS